ncbi:hypothetical protein VIGAN_03210000, partial [Vigna angularis var. angularis]
SIKLRSTPDACIPSCFLSIAAQYRWSPLSFTKPLVLDNIRFASLTISLIGVIFLGANFIPSIWDAFQFTGATVAVCIGFIFPPAIT